MKTYFAAASAAVLVAFAAPAFAQSASPVTVYGNLGYSYVDASGSHFNVIDGRLGARAYRYFGAEGELGVGLGSTDLGGGVDAKIKTTYAGYAVAYAPILPNAELFARVGYGHSSVKTTFGGVSGTDGENSINYGAGGQYFVTAHDGVRAEYTRFDFRDSGIDSANVWSIGYVRKF